jgi:hypothetical protein
LPYLILRPVALTDDPNAREVVAMEPTTPPSRLPLARAALAKFIIEVLQEPTWDRREVTVGRHASSEEPGVLKRTVLTGVGLPAAPEIQEPGDGAGTRQAELPQQRSSRGDALGERKEDGTAAEGAKPADD